jgi:hypothetical protein
VEAHAGDCSVTRFLLYLSIAAALVGLLTGAAAPWLEEHRSPVRDDWRHYQREFKMWELT